MAGQAQQDVGHEAQELELERIELRRERSALIAQLRRQEAAAADETELSSIRASLDALHFEELQDWRRVTKEKLACALLWEAETIRPLIECFRVPQTLKDELKQLLSSWEVARQQMIRVLTQSKYHQARLCAQRLEAHVSTPDGFVGRVRALINEVCSAHATEYMLEDLKLPVNHFVDMLRMLAKDRAAATTIDNPPARVHVALNRKECRREKLDRKRWKPLSSQQVDSLADPSYPESSAIARVDWERGPAAIGLPSDQAQAVQARIDGLQLQSAEAPEYLGWTPKHVENVRRSLEHDRPWGMKLREHFADYNPGFFLQPTENTSEKI